MRANFSDGTFAYANFTDTLGTVLFEPSQTPAILTMSMPLEGPTAEGAYVWHECLEFLPYDGDETRSAKGAPRLAAGHRSAARGVRNHRCSLIVRDTTTPVGGYTEHIHADPALIPVCPTSIHSPGLVIERIFPIS